MFFVIFSPAIGFFAYAFSVIVLFLINFFFQFNWDSNVRENISLAIGALTTVAFIYFGIKDILEDIKFKVDQKATVKRLREIVANPNISEDARQTYVELLERAEDRLYNRL